ncbi:hypothetical protein LTR84_009616 [Exophiala bonariae]|uniref:Nuclear pore assembly and biogenesis-domain-containing protein n=1 Tax=Exophiala bonariae TaxID=1690606 RepID=A0AAV9NJ64_9EURO|nr:hypothetical protein LTR84_009616 [Exophiala bonariae]
MAPANTLPAVLTHITTLYYSYLHPLLPSPVQSLIENVAPILTQVITSATSGDLTTLLATLVVIYLSLRIADYIRRSVIAWVMFFFKIALVIALVNAAFYVNRVGLDKALEDAEWGWDLIWGLAQKAINGAGGGSAGRAGGYGQWNLDEAQRYRIPVEGKRASKRRSGGWS